MFKFSQNAGLFNWRSNHSTGASALAEFSEQRAVSKREAPAAPTLALVCDTAGRLRGSQGTLPAPAHSLSLRSHHSECLELKPIQSHFSRFFLGLCTVFVTFYFLSHIKFSVDLLRNFLSRKESFHRKCQRNENKTMNVYSLKRIAKGHFILIQNFLLKSQFKQAQEGLILLETTSIKISLKISLEDYLHKQ